MVYLINYNPFVQAAANVIIYCLNNHNIYKEIQQYFERYSRTKVNRINCMTNLVLNT